jgi:hypothetical protein
VFCHLMITARWEFDPNSYPNQELTCVHGEAAGKL